MFPLTRLRRNRKDKWIRDLIAETSLSVDDLILPCFVIEGHNINEELQNMKGVYRMSIDILIEKLKLATDLGIKAVALFPYIDDSLKTSCGSEAFNLDNLISRTIRTIKINNINIGIIADVALDPYTLSGHDGILVDGKIDNDKTLESLSRQSLVLAKAGADAIAPSDMMDGRALTIREYIDDEGFSNINIFSYSVKYSSSFYSPFRGAINASSNLGPEKKNTYQMDKRNFKEALREAELDVQEGVDAIIIKPGLPCLDVIHAVSNLHQVPVFAFQVSGEYAMIQNCNNLDMDPKEILFESLISFKRAGANAIFCYGAIDVAKRISEHK